MTNTGMEQQANESVGEAKKIKKGLIARLFGSFGLQIAIVLVLLAIFAFFLIGAPQTFMSYAIYSAYMSTIPFFAVIALPLTLTIIAGEMDLSFPSIMAVGTVAFVAVYQATGSPFLGLVACLAMGFLAGLINGIIVVQLGVPSIVTTIGTQFFWRGFVLVLTGGAGASLVAIKPTLLHQLLVGRLFGVIPVQMIWMVLIAVFLWFFLNRHKAGAHIYLIGDNVESARLMGVNVDRTRILVFVIVGLAAAFGGILASLEVAYYWPTLGEGYMLRTLASVFLGGTSVFGGIGTVFGTFIASLIIGAIEGGIVAVGLTGFWTQLIYGVIITVSVAIQVTLNRRLGKV
jgi:simple sugar transport system permease protein